MLNLYNIWVPEWHSESKLCVSFAWWEFIACNKKHFNSIPPHSTFWHRTCLCPSPTSLVEKETKTSIRLTFCPSSSSSDGQKSRPQQRREERRTGKPIKIASHLLTYWLLLQQTMYCNLYGRKVSERRGQIKWRIDHLSCQLLASVCKKSQNGHARR